MFEAFPSGPHDPDGRNAGQLRQSLERVLAEREPDVLALIHYAIPLEGSGGRRFEDRYWSATHMPLFDERGEVVFILQHTVDVTELNRLKQMSGRPEVSLGSDILKRAHDVQKTNMMLEAERRHLRELFAQAPGFMAILRGPDHVFELVNESYRDLVGGRDVVGKNVLEALPEVRGQGFIDLLDRVYAENEAFVGSSVRVLLARGPDGVPQERYLDFVYQPVSDANGEVMGIFVQGNDVTERKLADIRQNMLIDELNHRVKNTLATVQSISLQTARSAASPEAFHSVFEARLLALSKAHNVLTQGQWESADFTALLRQELDPYGPSRVELDGPTVRVPPRVALTLAMAFHELATNAAKYGALSAPDGRVAVSWALMAPAEGGVPLLKLFWAESGGPAVEPPARRGFGSRMIERGVEGELRGNVEMVFAREGFGARIVVPLQAS
jgi:two-component sensor histidine kinase